MILAIDTSGFRCGAALWENELIAFDESDGIHKHNEVLLGQVQALLSENSVVPTMISAIGVSSGPGSFTGLRIGMAAAKGLCWSWNKPLILVPTLEGLANSAPTRAETVVPLMPVRANEVYWSVFQRQDGEMVRCQDDDIIEIEKLPEVLRGKVFFCGDGYHKHQEKIDRLFGPNIADFSKSEQIKGLAVSTARLTESLFYQKRFSYLLEAEPQYCYSFPRQRRDAI
ncbi:MAG: tRNA (adenosine(37)-N6)-threonylcarbamoyltransferase complex dimerization subunit type 1 TsaB [bacterium]